MRKRFYKTLLILLKEKKYFFAILYGTYISYIKGGTSFLNNKCPVMESMVKHPSVHADYG